MLTIAKKNKRIEETLEKFKENILKQSSPNNPSNILKGSFSNEEKDAELLSFYANRDLENYQLHVSHKLITEMPFNQAVNLDFLKKNDTYKPFTIHKGQYETVDYPVYDCYGGSYTPLAVLDESVTLPMICEDEVGWMTPVLFEENTMRPCVEKAHGHVLVVGLGIGFFPFNILLKEEVKKVTIIEYNQKIIDLFNTYILPQFPRKEDIEIIHGNAFDYLRNDYIKQYDYTFVDIWRNNEDGVVILSDCLQNIDLNEDLAIDFWVEDAILEEVKQGFRVYLYQLYHGKLASFLTGAISEVRVPENFVTFDKIHRFFKEKTIKIKTNRDLLNIVNDKKLIREMLKSF